jgi:hypothetical protein
VASRARSSWGGNRRQGSLGLSSSGRAWSAAGNQAPAFYDSPAEAGWDGRGLGAEFGHALGKGIIDGLAGQPGEGSAAFWRGVAACALVVAAIILVLWLTG